MRAASTAAPAPATSGARATTAAPATRAAPAVAPRARRRARRPAALLVVLVMVVLGLAGCGVGGAAEDSAAEGEAGIEGGGQAAPDQGGGGGPEEGTAGEAGVGDDTATGTGDVPPGVGAPGGAGRRVVTSSIDVAVEDVPAAADQVRSLAVRAGGEVADESSTGGERPRAEIVLRVPADDTPGVLEEVAALGEEVSRTARSEPVETRLVDLESRTATQRAGVGRIRALLEQATTLEDVLALEAELTRRQADLEAVDAQRAALADLAAMATVTVRLTTPDDVDAPGRELPPFLRGLDAGWEALSASTTIVLVVLGGLLPFVVVGALVLAAVLSVLRLRRRRRPTAPAPPAGHGPSGAGPAGPVPTGPGPGGQARGPGEPHRP